MSEDFIAAQLILNSLYGTEEFEIYDDPLNKILGVCQTLKKYIKGYENREAEYINHGGVVGNPKPLPIKLSENSFSTAFSKIIKKDWNMEVLTEEQKESIVEKIIKKYRCKDAKKKEYIKKSLKEEGSSFLRELESLSSKDLKERLDDWSSSYEVENLLDEIEKREILRKQQSKEKSVNKKPSIPPSKPLPGAHFDSIGYCPEKKKPRNVTFAEESKELDNSSMLDTFIRNNYAKNAIENPGILKIREAHANAIDFVFNEQYESNGFTINDYNNFKGIDVQYRGKFPPSKNYIRKYLLPWLIIELSYRYKIDYKDEGSIYNRFSTEYKKLATQRKK
jgi:hypothetical protein